MKTSNIKYSTFAKINNEICAHRFFVTEEAKNKWCNKQYRVFGEDVEVEVYDFKTDLLLERWHA